MSTPASTPSTDPSTGPAPGPVPAPARRAPRGAVVVTGASSGIGRSTALALAAAGFHVFAGMHHEHHFAALDGHAGATAAGGGITPVHMDVTDAGLLAEAAHTVEQALTGGEAGATGLTGVVNNAGIGVMGPVEAVPLDEVRRQFEVNFIGQIAVTQAFLPLLHRSHGRVVNIGSAGSWITMPFGGPLCAAKHAFRAVNDALRMELAPAGIRVCLIEPGAINTPAVDDVENGTEPAIAGWHPDHQARYATAFRSWSRAVVRQERAGSTPEVVADAILKALTAARPRTRYPVGSSSRLLSVLARTAPNPLLDPLRMRLLGLRAYAKGN
jgi:NAD(P)-dependent dehydrogenase (short-subunit alcohol dehydrogenase family)